MKHKKKSRLAAVELTVVLIATAVIFALARSYGVVERGNNAQGGEFMLLLIPIIYYELKRIIRDYAEDIRELIRNAPED